MRLTPSISASTISLTSSSKLHLRFHPCVSRRERAVSNQSPGRKARLRAKCSREHVPPLRECRAAGQPRPVAVEVVGRESARWPRYREARSLWKFPHEVALVDANQNLARLGALANLFNRVALALPDNLGPDDRERLFDKLADGVSLAGCEDEIVRLVLLQHAPHALDVIAGVTPVTLGVKVSEVLVTTNQLTKINSSDSGKKKLVARTRQSC